jgi:hypothetical protein
MNWVELIIAIAVGGNSSFTRNQTLALCSRGRCFGRIGCWRSMYHRADRLPNRK